MHGKFFVIDGLDGAGKSTIIKGVKRSLSKRFKRKIVLTAEPTNSFFGQELRRLLKSEKNPLKDGHAFLALYVADRKHHLKKTVLPALAKNQIVLCDRYKYSTLVYQSIQGVNAKEIVKLHEKMLKPNTTFVLDLPVETALTRIAFSKRKNSEVFEKKSFLKKARKKFLELKKFFPHEKFVIVDASKPKKVVVKKIVSEISKRL